MALAISISFPAGRFHATPWGHHVNEGLPEWPPSPWRLLRALVATWKHKLHQETLVNEQMSRIIAKLITPPIFKLPPATLGHTRHFMPWFKKGPDDKVLVFDTFVALEPGAEVVFVWPDVTLSTGEQQTLSIVLSQLNYFGRAESWCSARIAEPPPEREINCWVASTEIAAPPTALERVRVLCADPKTWGDWSYGKTYTAKCGKPDPLWNLLAETPGMQAEKWTNPPGSQWITYLRPSDAFVSNLKTAPSSRGGSVRPVTAARFALDGPVLPLITETLYLGEIARRFLQGIFGRLFPGDSSPVLSGKDNNGNPMSGHEHAFFLPTDEDGDGRLDHLTIYCRGGLGRREQRALDAWRRLRRPTGGVDLNLALLGFLYADSALANDVAILSAATKWRSVTPFVPTRHFKQRGRKRDKCRPEQFTEVVLREEIARRHLPEPIAVRRLPRCTLWDHAQRRQATSGRSFAWLQFRRDRVYGNGRRGLDPGGGFEIEFPQQVKGPLALGYGCHFGLGLFAPTQS